MEMARDDGGEGDVVVVCRHFQQTLGIQRNVAPPPSVSRGCVEAVAELLRGDFLFYGYGQKYQDKTLLIYSFNFLEVGYNVYFLMNK